MKIESAEEYDPDQGGRILSKYIDSHIRILDSMYAKRLRTYKRTGFQVITNNTLIKQSVNF